MSVLIKGMMMPINCQTCPFVKDVKHAATPEYEVVIDLRCGFTQMLADNPAFERNKDCPLSGIPPHGRLIDSGALLEKINGIWDCNDMLFEDDNICGRIRADCNSCRWRETRDAIAKIVERMPTITGAEEVKE